MHPKHPGSTESGIIDGIDSRHHPGMCCSSLRSFLMSATFKYNHRFHPRRRPRRRHKLAGVGDHLHVKKDGLGGQIG